ncbi:UNVERIFIED_CONTAM: hypothetical protein Slati_4610900, partial [Sesamum latifolium]
MGKRCEQEGDPETSKGTPPKVQPSEELLNIKLVPGDPEKVTRIGSQMDETIRREVVQCLQRNIDVFAWTLQDLEGIDPEVITHHLNIDPQAEGRYTPIEKMALALVITARRLRPYFLTHPVGVKTNMPLKQTLGKPDTSGCLIKWAVELSEYDISYLPCTTIKAQALVDFVSKMTGIPSEEASKDEKWLFHVDWSSTIQDSDAGIVITSPPREDLEFAVKFGFKASNNEAEYEALVAGMKMAHEAEARHLLAYSDSQL